VDCNSLAFEADALWATCPVENRVLRVDPKTNVVVERIEAAQEPMALAFAEGSLFVLGKKEGKISKIDPKTNKVTATIETQVPGANGYIAIGDGYLWLSQTGFPLTKVNLKTEKILQQFFGDGAGTIKFAAGSLWLASAGKPELKRIDPKRVAATLAD
jgi:streptogramin lyase